MTIDNKNPDKHTKNHDSHHKENYSSTFSSEPFLSDLAKFIKDNFFNFIPFCISFGSIVGGLIFIAYFNNINYTPALDFNSYLSILLAAACFGTIITFSLAGIIFAPGLIWYGFNDQNEELYRTYEATSCGLLFTIWFFGPLIILVGCFFSLSKFNELNQSIQTESNWSLTLPFIFVLISFSLSVYLTYLFTKWIVFKENNTHSNSHRQKWKQRFSINLNDALKISATWFISIFIPQVVGYSTILLLINEGKVDFITSESKLLVDIFPVITVSFISNFSIINILNRNKGIRRYPYIILAVLTSLFVIISTSSNSGFIPSLVMRNFGWGNLDNIDIILDKTGFQIFEKASPNQFNCEISDNTSQLNNIKLKKIDLSQNDNTLYKLCDIDLILGLGDTYLFGKDFSSNQANKIKHELRIRIPKKNVLSIITTKKTRNLQTQKNAVQSNPMP